MRLRVARSFPEHKHNILEEEEGLTSAGVASRTRARRPGSSIPSMGRTIQVAAAGSAISGTTCWSHAPAARPARLQNSRPPLVRAERNLLRVRSTSTIR